MVRCHKIPTRKSKHISDPVLFDLAPLHTFASDHSKGGLIFGSVSYTSTQATDIMSGLHYINIYTDANPGGEIRGQLIVVPEPGTKGLLCLGGVGCLLAASWWRRNRAEV